MYFKNGKNIKKISCKKNVVKILKNLVILIISMVNF